MNNEDRKALEVAWLIYEKDLQKKEAAEALGILPQRIGQLLKRARERGLVQHHFRVPAIEELRAEFRYRFPFVKEVIIVPAVEDFELERRMLAQSAADYFEKIVKDNMHFALGGGNTLYEMIDLLPIRDRNIQIFPTAIIGQGPNIVLPDRTIIVSLLWSKSGKKRGTAHFASVLPYENFHPSEVKQRCADFLKNPIVSEVFEGMKKVDCVFTSLGSMEGGPEYKQYSPQTTLEKLHEIGFPLAELKRQGVVGEVSYDFYNADGNVVDHFCFAISLGVEHLKAMVRDNKTVVVIAGKYKEPGLEAILRGEIGNVIITSENTARTIIERKTEESQAKNEQNLSL
jgi:deoxyribonucleoside regulator